MELRLKQRKIKDNMELAGLLRSYIQNEKAGEIKSIAKKVETMKKCQYAVRDPENFQH